VAHTHPNPVPGSPVLRLTGITKDFPGTRALDGVDFEVASGEIHALVGENGAGKSTLMNVIGGIYPGYTGQVELQGSRARMSGPRDADRLGLRVIHQELSLVPRMTVAENIMLGQEPAGRWRIGVDRVKVRERAQLILADLGFALPLDQPVEQLGTGQQQLVEIAHAFAREMRVLVLDEPTAALPQADVGRLFGVLRDLRARGLAIIYISHRLAELPHIADRVTVLRDGRSLGTYAMTDLSMGDVSRLMLGRDLQDAFPPRGPVGTEVLLSVRDLQWPGRIDGVSFELHAGEVLGLAGLIGAGRTEVLRCLFGAGPKPCRIGVLGQEVLVGSPRDAARRGLALIPEDRRGQGLVLCRPVAENVVLASLRRLGRWGLVRRQQVFERARELMVRFAVSPADPDTPVGNLSGGNQQKVVVAKWVATQPRVFLFDEPTRGLDVGTKAEIYRLIAELAAAGHGVLIVSSELPEVIGLAHRILVLREGRVAAEVPGERADEDQLLRLSAGEGASQ